MRIAATGIVAFLISKVVLCYQVQQVQIITGAIDC